MERENDMKNYDVFVTERFFTTVTVQAETEREAEDKVWLMLENGEESFPSFDKNNYDGCEVNAFECYEKGEPNDG